MATAAVADETQRTSSHTLTTDDKHDVVFPKGCAHPLRIGVDVSTDGKLCMNVIDLKTYQRYAAVM